MMVQGGATTLAGIVAPPRRERRRSALLHAGEQPDLVAGWVAEDGEPAGLRDLCLGYNGCAAEGLRLAQVGIDVLARHVEERLAGLVRLCASGFLGSGLDEATARTAFGLEHVVVEVGIRLDLPAKQVRVEFARRLGITRWELDVHDRMSRHEPFSFPLRAEPGRTKRRPHVHNRTSVLESQGLLPFCRS